MREYRKRPLRIRAMPLTVDTANELCDMIPDSELISAGIHHPHDPQGTPLMLIVPTLEGKMFADVGKCWIVQGIQGEWYPSLQQHFRGHLRGSRVR